MPRLKLLLPLLAALVLLAPAGAQAKVTLGLADGVFTDPVRGPAWLDRAVALGAQELRVTAIWRDIAPAQPSASFDPTDPASPEYRFGGVDATIAAARARDLDVLLLVSQAPDWAEGPGRTGDFTGVGAWRPDPKAFGQFMTAVARRYAGQVEAYELWNEPNLPTYLAPQWRRSGGRFVEESPRIYKALVNTGYAGAKAGDPSARVVVGSTGPYGEPKAGQKRMAPARFWRALLCLRGTSKAPRTASCDEPLRADVLSHHPYGVGSPQSDTYWPDDVTLGELDRLERAWRLAERTGRLLPAGKRPRWATEFGWESRPDPDAPTDAQQARYLAEGLQLLDAAGYAKAHWFLIRDDGKVRGAYVRSFQSGLYQRGGKAKPSAAMFRFPLAATRNGSRTRLYGVPPASGPCTIRRNGDVVKSLTCRAGVPVTTSLARRKGAQFRLHVGDLRSPVAVAP